MSTTINYDTTLSDYGPTSIEPTLVDQFTDTSIHTENDIISLLLQRTSLNSSNYTKLISDMNLSLQLIEDTNVKFNQFDEDIQLLRDLTPRMDSIVSDTDASIDAFTTTLNELTDNVNTYKVKYDANVDDVNNLKIQLNGEFDENGELITDGLIQKLSDNTISISDINVQIIDILTSISNITQNENDYKDIINTSINDINSNITTLNTALEELNTTLSNDITGINNILLDTVDENEETVPGLISKVSQSQEDIISINETISKNDTTIQSIKTQVDNTETLINDSITTSIADLETKVNETINTSITNINTEISNNKSYIDNIILDTVDENDETIPGLISKVDNNIANISNLNNTINDNKTLFDDSINTINTNINDLNTTVTDNNTNINNILLDTVDENDETIPGLISKVDNNIANITDLNTIVTDNKTLFDDNINTITTNITDLNTAVTDNTNNITTVNNIILDTTDSNNETIPGLISKVDNNITNISNLTITVNEIDDKITEVVDTAIEDINTNIESVKVDFDTRISSNLNILNFMNNDSIEFLESFESVNYSLMDESDLFKVYRSVEDDKIRIYDKINDDNIEIDNPDSEAIVDQIIKLVNDNVYITTSSAIYKYNITDETYNTLTIDSTSVVLTSSKIIITTGSKIIIYDLNFNIINSFDSTSNYIFNNNTYLFVIDIIDDITYVTYYTLNNFTEVTKVKLTDRVFSKAVADEDNIYVVTDNLDIFTITDNIRTAISLEATPLDVVIGKTYLYILLENNTINYYHKIDKILNTLTVPGEFNISLDKFIKIVNDTIYLNSPDDNIIYSFKLKISTLTSLENKLMEEINKLKTQSIYNTKELQLMTEGEDYINSTVNNIIYHDDYSGDNYKLYLDDGTMYITTEDLPLEYRPNDIIYTDTSTGDLYKIIVDDSELRVIDYTDDMAQDDKDNGVVIINNTIIYRDKTENKEYNLAITDGDIVFNEII